MPASRLYCDAVFQSLCVKCMVISLTSALLLGQSLLSPGLAGKGGMNRGPGKYIASGGQDAERWQGLL